MEFIPPELEKAMDLSKSDPECAAEVLRIAAKYLKSSEQMPYSLALFLADAIESAMKMASMVRASELLINLNLKARNRRPTSNFRYVGHDLQVLIDRNIPKGEALAVVGEKYAVDEKTVARMYAEYLTYINWEEEQQGAWNKVMFHHTSDISSNRRKAKKSP
jgi:hypothetical protein